MTPEEIARLRERFGHPIRCDVADLCLDCIILRLCDDRERLRLENERLRVVVDMEPRLREELRRRGLASPSPHTEEPRT